VIDPDPETLRRCQWPRKVAQVFGTRGRNPSWPAFMCERDNTGRTYNRKRHDQTMAESSCETGGVHIWHLDEVAISIAGRKHWLWRAVDQHGVVLDILVQTCCRCALHDGTGSQ
jgi:hypothetical protein